MANADTNAVTLTDKARWRYVSPSPRFGHSMCNAHDTHLYIFGGCEGANHFLNDLHVLDVNTAQWCQLHIDGTPPSPRAFHSACLVKDSLFIFGGRNAKGHSNGLYMLNLQRGWSRARLPNAPSPRSGHCACLCGDQMYVFGGDVNDSKMYALNVEDMRWAQVHYSGNMPICVGQSACQIDGKMVWTAHGFLYFVFCLCFVSFGLFFGFRLAALRNVETCMALCTALQCLQSSLL